MTETPARRVKVLLVDDDALVRTGLRMMLGGAGDLELVGEVADGSEVLDAVRRLAPDVVLMDIRMPEVDGIAATRTLAARGGDGPHVVILTAIDPDGMVLEAMRAGAAGFLLKHSRPAEIVQAVRRAAEGEPVLSPQAARTLIDHAAGTPQSNRRRQHARAQLEMLSPGERDVAAAVALGMSNAEIAARLYMSTGTVKAHISSALTKLDLANRIQLALTAHDAEE
ncbi:MAG: response regulator transcription factor [Stackebrandtia sp.]